MSTNLETLILDSAGASPLTLQSGGTSSLDAFDPGVAQRRPNWIGGPESDGSLLAVDPPYDDAQGSFRVRFFPTTAKDMPTALGYLHTLVGKLQECSASGPQGLACSWTPANHTSTYTIYLKLAEPDGLPIEMSGDLSGWFAGYPVVTVNFTRDPFLYGAAIDTVTDSFSTNTIANYTFLAGSGTLAVSGGQLVPSSTAVKRLYRSVGGYDGLGAYYASQVTVKFTTGATVVGQGTAVLLKVLGTQDWLSAYVSGTSGTLDIVAMNSGVTSSLAPTTTGSATISSGTSYWLRFRSEGNALTAELWTAAPTATGSPVTTATVTMAGAFATKYGLGISGKVGLEVTPPGTDYRYDDLVVEPNVGKSLTPLLTLTLPGVPGDVAAFTQLVFTDLAAQARRWIEYGIQQRYWQNLSLLFDSSSLTTSGFAGSSTTRSGSYGTNVVRSPGLIAQPTAVAGLLNQGHVGTFRVRQRVWATSPDVRVRLAWNDGSGAYHTNAWATPPVEDAFSDVDLGTITVTPALSGTQAWNARIEALSTTTGDTVDLDTTTLMPAGEGYGKLRAAYNYTAGAIIGYDDFAGTTAGASLGTRAAPAGGSWATSGATTDWVFADDILFSGLEGLSRSTSSDTGNGRIALLGTATPTDTEVGVRISALAPSVAAPGLIARYVDASNYLIAQISGDSLGVRTRVAGVETVIASDTVRALTAGVLWLDLRLVGYASGSVIVTVTDSAGLKIAEAIGYSADLATGGTLASGKRGINDLATGIATARYYLNPYVATPAAEPLVLNSGRQAQIRTDGAIRQDSTGTYSGNWPLYGDYPTIPPAGAENRTTRIAARARRNDIEAAAEANVTDALAVQAIITPRYLTPR